MTAGLVNQTQGWGISEPRLVVCSCFLLTHVDPILAPTTSLAMPASVMLTLTVYLLHQWCPLYECHIMLGLWVSIMLQRTCRQFTRSSGPWNERTISNSLCPTMRKNKSTGVPNLRWLHYEYSRMNLRVMALSDVISYDMQVYNALILCQANVLYLLIIFSPGIKKVRCEITWYADSPHTCYG